MDVFLLGNLWDGGEELGGWGGWGEGLPTGVLGCWERLLGILLGVFEGFLGFRYFFSRNYPLFCLLCFFCLFRLLHLLINSFSVPLPLLLLIPPRHLLLLLLLIIHTIQSPRLTTLTATMLPPLLKLRRKLFLLDLCFRRFPDIGALHYIDDHIVVVFQH